MNAQPTERDRERARALLNSFGLHPRTCGPAKAAAICDRLAQALADARAEERERCRLICKQQANDQEAIGDDHGALLCDMIACSLSEDTDYDPSRDM